MDLQRAIELLPLHWRRYRRELASREARAGLPLSLIDQPASHLALTLDMLVSHYRQSHPEVYFLQVGAFDGVSADPIYPLVEKHGLRGYLIEPQADAFARLKANYARFGDCGFTFVRAAIADHDGTMPLYRIKPGADCPNWLPGVASLAREFPLRHAHVVPGLDSMIEIEQVPCMTFATLFQTYGERHIDLLQVDAEGFDARILRLFDVPARLPAIIRFEHKHLSEVILEETLLWLAGLGYKVTLCGADVLAYHSSHIT